jgi:hypothetical protein
VTGYRSRGRLRKDQLARAVLDDFEDKRWTGQSMLGPGVGLKLHCGLLLKASQVAIATLDDDTLPCSGFTAGLNLVPTAWK